MLAQEHAVVHHIFFNILTKCFHLLFFVADTYVCSYKYDYMNVCVLIFMIQNKRKEKKNVYHRQSRKTNNRNWYTEKPLNTINFDNKPAPSANSHIYAKQLRQSQISFTILTSKPPNRMSFFIGIQPDSANFQLILLREALSYKTDGMRYKRGYSWIVASLLIWTFHMFLLFVNEQMSANFIKFNMWPCKKAEYVCFLWFRGDFIDTPRSNIFGMKFHFTAEPSVSFSYHLN